MDDKLTRFLKWGERYEYRLQDCYRRFQRYEDERREQEALARMKAATKGEVQEDLE